ncbi:MAG: class I SAM-dependent methyltransferase [bacterium]
MAFSPEAADSAESFKTDYFKELADLEASSFWFCSRNRLIIWALNRYFPDANSFFETGCGTGFVLSGIGKARPEMSLFGSDLFSSGLKFASERIKHADLFQMDARHIPFENEFDVIGAFDLLEHVEEDTLVLSEIYKALRAGGGVVLTVPQHAFLWSHADEYACHCRRYGARELRAKVRLAGFNVVKDTSFVTFLMPLMLAARLLKRRPDTNDGAIPELKIRGIVNTVLQKVMDFERAFIRAGIRLPAGGSLLLIARKD